MAEQTATIPHENGQRLEYVRRSLTSASGALLQPKFSANGGISIESSKECIDEGTLLVQCQAAAVALDQPYRTSHCAYCCNPSNTMLCQNCRCVAICSSCRSKYQAYHSSSSSSSDGSFTALSECAVLKSLSESLSELGSTAASDGTNVDNNIEEKAPEIDTTILLAIRLMFRRWKEEDCKHLDDPKPAQSRMKKTDWNLFDALYAAPTQAISSEPIYAKLLATIRAKLIEKMKTTDEPAANGWEWLSLKSFCAVVSRIMGCGHAVTDLTRQLGNQSLGKAVFLEHSFYNHACSPNAFISCPIGVSRSKSIGWVTARVHLTNTISKNAPITLSYIQMSGIDRAERQQKLTEGYDFECQCMLCQNTANDDSTDNTKAANDDTESAYQINQMVRLPSNHDIDSIRMMQHQWAETLNQIESTRQRSLGNLCNTNNPDDEDILAQAKGMITMTMRGIANQKIPSSHEVSLEAHRLLAMAESLLGNSEDAILHHDDFFANVPCQLVDSVTLVQQHLARAFDYGALRNFSMMEEDLNVAKVLAGNALGGDHPLLILIVAGFESIRQHEAASNKKQKLSK